MECPDNQHAIQEVDVIFLNTWNELFCVSMRPEQLGAWMARMKRHSTRVTTWLPKEGNTRVLNQALVSLTS